MEWLLPSAEGRRERPDGDEALYGSAPSPQALRGGGRLPSSVQRRRAIKRRPASMPRLPLVEKDQEIVKIERLAEVGHRPLVQGLGELFAAGRGDQDRKNRGIELLQPPDQVQSAHAGQIQINQSDSRRPSGLKRHEGLLGGAERLRMVP